MVYYLFGPEYTGIGLYRRDGKGHASISWHELCRVRKRP
ncbi:hypothetical protein BAME_29660 [Bacillus sp. M 2-6]|nr:hypothetical protein BAME_29660 [Bacillus sp. M 2-6]